MIALIADVRVFLDYLYRLNFLQYIFISLEWEKQKLENNGLNYYRFSG